MNFLCFTLDEKYFANHKWVVNSIAKEISRYCVKLNLFNYVLAYSVPNFLVIQYLEILYLGENNVKVVCVRVWRIDQVCASKGNSRLNLATNSRVVTCQNLTRVEHAGNWRVRIAKSLQDKKYILTFLLTSNWNLRLIPVAKWLISAPYFVQN